MSGLRRRVGDVFVTATCDDDGGAWSVVVTDAFFVPVKDEEKRQHALRAVLDELSSLRAHIWHEELGQSSGSASAGSTAVPRQPRVEGK